MMKESKHRMLVLKATIVVSVSMLAVTVYTVTTLFIAERQLTLERVVAVMAMVLIVIACVNSYGKTRRAGGPR